MKKKLSIGVIGMVMTGLLLSACGSKPAADVGTQGAETKSTGAVKTIKVAHVLAENHPYHKGSVKFKEIVEKESNGRLKVEIYSSGTLGGEGQLVNSMQSNTIQAAIIGGTMGVVDPKFLVIDLPFAFKDREHAYKVLDGELGNKLFSYLPDKKLKGLAYWENGFRHITNSVRPIKTPDDLKGIKLRVPENKVSISIFKALGAAPTPIPSPEVFTALEQKVVDGQENPIANIHSSKYQEVQKYMSLTGHMYGAAPFVMSLAFYDGLSDDLKKIVDKAALEARDYNRQLIKDNEAKLLEEIKAEGVEVIEVDRSLFQAQTKSVYTEMESVVGKELIDTLLKQ